jgi:hypothetical protein
MSLKELEEVTRDEDDDPQRRSVLADRFCKVGANALNALICGGLVIFAIVAL